MADKLHPFYQLHRAAMQTAMRQRADLAEAIARERGLLAGQPTIAPEVMAQFDKVLATMPYVGGEASRMSDFFMRLLGFIAISRVLRQHGVPVAVIGAIERETYKQQLLTVPEDERLAAGRQFLSPENQAHVREQAAFSRQQTYADDFVYDFVAPGPGDDFAFGINYTACGFCKFAARHGDTEILPNLCELDFDAYATRGVRLVRTQTLAGGASHCDFRFSILSNK